MSIRPNPVPGDLGPNGAPDQSPKSPRYWIAIAVLVALSVVALAFFAHAR